MRVFLNIGLTEHTGHGVPTIIKKYGKDIYEITDNYIKCIIPFDNRVLGRVRKLQKKGIIERIGSKRNGRWVVIKYRE